MAEGCPITHKVLGSTLASWRGEKSPLSYFAHVSLLQRCLTIYSSNYFSYFSNVFSAVLRALLKLLVYTVNEGLALSRSITITVANSSFDFSTFNLPEVSPLMEAIPKDLRVSIPLVRSTSQNLQSTLEFPISFSYLLSSYVFLVYIYLYFYFLLILKRPAKVVCQLYYVWNM